MIWFLECLERAIKNAGQLVDAVLAKAVVWRKLAEGVPVTDRQRMVVNRLLDGFQGGMTTSKYARITKCSSDTALRDIQDLETRGILVKNPGRGRSTSYSLADLR
jgi:Fic family protein